MAFYVLEREMGPRFELRWATGLPFGSTRSGEPNLCPVCGRPVGLRKWLPPHRLKLSSSRPGYWGDLLWGAGFRLMVSARFRAIYEEEGLSGIASFSPAAEVIRLGTKRCDEVAVQPPVYHVVDIIWNGANLDDRRSGVVRKGDPCWYDRGAVARLERVELEAGSWTGADIFEARGLFGTFLVSERFRQVVEGHGVTNAWLIRSEQYGYDERRTGLAWYVRDA